MTAVTLDDVLACPNLPSLPTIAVELLELTSDQEVTVDEIAQVVQNDPALSAKILRTVNSSYYALEKPCPTISRALTYMGLSTVKSLVLGFSLTHIKPNEPGFDLNDYWQRCLYAAASARRIAQAHGKCDPDEAFAAALMQDIGMLATHAAVGAAYGQVVARTQGDHRRLPEVERSEFEFDHTEAGAKLAERWRLPPQIVESIRHHHGGEPDRYEHIVRTGSLACEMATTVLLPNPGAAVTMLREHAEAWFALDTATVNDLVKQVGDDIAELGELFDIGTGKPLDVNWILTQAEEASVVNQLASEREKETLRQTADEMARMAVTDGLTNIGNRKRFEDELATRYDQAVSFRGTLGLIMADADRFKRLNDTWGHQAGDAVLIELANRFKGAVRGVDVVCRYGGEEFGIILPGANVRDVAMIAERLRTSIADQPFDLAHVDGVDNPLEVTVSLGAAVYDQDTAAVVSTASVLVKAADKALYAAKESGRNCVRVFRLPGQSAAAAA